MSYLPNYFYNSSIYSYVESLIGMGFERYQDMKTAQKQKISALIIRELGADDFESMVGSDNCSDTMSVFAEALLNNSKESDEKLLAMIKMNAIRNHGWQIDELISEIKESHSRYKKIEHGYINYVDKQTGESCWRKSA